ncbi:MBL fold metallo-hydrolase [Belnapia sp. T6]|uniref:MBL fold metallo-hydrolase n=1 Tax=Belnapia mucosa TaxID=2804532 RepID=A0ABS1V920_9PROT|nr:MBL fold metallo-hydrolase [Belnapia mucosa]MBL6458171.1 MBL fold metallo-hydrolase [Belnapia mucosa]
MGISLKVCGAARTVTGLCLLFETPDARFLVDCGMFQGPKTLKALNYEPFPFDPRDIDAVLLTHAHIDHSGLIPRLVKQGFRGAVHATQPTIELCSCMLPDAGHIQEFEVKALNRRNRRRGQDPVRPIYTAADAEHALTAFQAVAYDEWVSPIRGLRARWWNAGHMLGSASIELEFALPGRAMRVLVSGDVGPKATGLQPMSTGPVGGVDHVIVESTYGDEDRPLVTPEARRAALAEVVRLAASQGGALLIPTFAVERAQEVVLDLVRLMQANEIPAADIHLDSPLAIRASRVFERNAAALDDGQAMREALASPRLRYELDGEASRRIARLEGFHIVLAGSGMCEAGRIRQHLKARLWDARAVVALVGFQAMGTLGRLLQDGASRVRIQGETFQVAARITRIEGYSAHADGPELGRWIEARRPVGGGVFLVHGEPDAIEGLAKRVVGRGIAPDAAVIRPKLDEVFRLEPGVVPMRDAAASLRRRDATDTVGEPDWHNRRAALLLSIEEALDRATDDQSRAALIDRLRRAMG